MRVTIRPDGETREVSAGSVGDLLKTLGLHSDAYLVVQGEEILTRDVRLRGDEELDVIPVISGGTGRAFSRKAGQWDAELARLSGKSQRRGTG